MAINFNEIPAVAAQGLTRLITDYGNMARQKAEQDRAINEYLTRTTYNTVSNVLGGLADISGNAFMSGANTIGGAPELLWNSTLGREGAGLETLARQAATADYYGAGMKRGLDRILNPFSPTPYTPAETIVNTASMIPAAGTAVKGATNVAKTIDTGIKAIGKQKGFLNNAIKSVEQSAAKAASLADEVNDLRKLQGSIADLKSSYIKRGASEPAMWREGGDIAKTAQINYLTGQNSRKALPSTLKKYNDALDDVNTRIAQAEKSMAKATGQTSNLKKQVAAQAAAYDSAAGQALDDVLTAFGGAGSTVMPKVLLGAAGSGLSGQIANMLKDGEPVNLEPIIQNRERNTGYSTAPNYVEATQPNWVKPLDKWNDAVLSKAMSGLPTPEARVVEAAQPTPAYVGSPTYNYLAGRPKVITPIQRAVQEAQAVPQDVDLTKFPSYKKLQEIAANAKTQEDVIAQLTQQQAARRKALADESDNSIMRWIGHILTLPFALRRGESPALTWARTQAGIEANDTELSEINQKLAAAAGLPTELELAQAMNSAALEAITKSADIQSKKDKSYLQSMLAEANAQRLEAVKGKTDAELALKQARVDQDREKLNNDIKAARAKLGVAEANLLKSQIEGALNFGFGSVPSDEALAAREAIANLEPGTLVKYKYALLANSQGQAGDKLLNINDLKASVFSK